MKKFVATVALSFALTTPAFAEGFFIGGDVGITLGYPDRTSDVGNGLLGAGATSAHVSQKVASTALALRGGQWMGERFGWELGYDGLGSVDGTWSSTGSTTGSYKYSASAFHLAALGGIPVGRGKIYGKAGIFSGSTKEEASNTIGYHESTTTSSTGLLIGAGYEFSFTEKLAGHVGANLFNGMKFHNFATNTSDTKTLINVAFGVDFKF
jgi:hypothetical protein